MLKVIVNSLLVLCLGALLTSCGDDSLTSEADVSLKQEVINALNTDQADKALALATAGEINHPEDQEFTYYKAQAYSLKAQIDIYTLFPIVQMQVFDVAINEWNKANEFEKRRRDSVNISILGEEDKDKKFENDEIIRAEIKRLEGMTPEQISNIELNFRVVYSYGYGNITSTGQEGEITSCYLTYELTSEEIKTGNSPFRSYLNYKKGEKSCSDGAKDQIEPTYPALKVSVHQYAIRYYQERLKKLGQRRGQERYIKSALALFDSVPILKKIPIIAQENFEDLYHSLDILTDLHSSLPKNSRLWKNAYQQMGLIGGYLITYSIKDAIDLEGVKSPYDLICKVNPSKLVNNYRHLLAGGKTLLNVTLNSKFYEKNQENMDKARDYIREAPETLSEEQKEDIIDDIVDFQEDNC